VSVIFIPLYSNSFQGPNQNPLSDGGNWTTDPNFSDDSPLEILNGQAVGSNSGSGQSYYSGGVDLTSDQFIQYTISSFQQNIGDDETFAYIRYNTTTGTGYRLQIEWQNSLGNFLVRVIAPNTNVISSQHITLNIGDVMALSAFGSTIMLTQNSKVLFSGTDTTSDFDGTVALGVSPGLGADITRFTNFSTGSVVEGGNVSGNAGVADATVNYRGSASGSVTADGSGNYAIPLANGNYTITPSLNGYTFVPVSQAVTVSGSDITGVNFTAVPVGVTAYSVTDCRNYGTFPNNAVDVNGTLQYTVPAHPSTTPPTDSRADVPVASGTYPQNSRTPGTFGPGE
jgi:hypothetical protein